jgi:glutamate---cysteine ligase / carboxylate-amine ligase
VEFRRDHHLKLPRFQPPVRSGRDAFMLAGDDSFRFGIEEEYFLADARTLEVAAETPKSLFDYAHDGMAGRLAQEMLQAQLEVATEPHTSFADARLELLRLRKTAAGAAAQCGLVILAAGTHPTAQWREAVQTPKERYDLVMDGLQMIGQRNMLCGMHVHVELPDPSRRIDVMSRMLPYIPLFLALSTSSPFWQRHATGLKGYRLAAYDELPRTGLPELFRNNEEYDAYVMALVRSGVICDASHIWWAVRPSQKYPTLELRAPDSCTRLGDAVAIAALYRALVRHLYVDPDHNAGLDCVARALAVENKWRAQRYGVQGTFATAAGAVTGGEMLEQLIDLLADDVAALDCAEEVEHCRGIVENGTSADAQLRAFQDHEQEGPEAALRAVAQWIADATLQS